ncbi:MAG: hypothetical protein ACP5OM_04915 [Methanothrix sp.]
MFSEKDLVERSVEDMAAEVKGLLAEAERLRDEHDRALEKEMLLRTRSVEARSADGELAERLWQEAEGLHEAAKENMRLSTEKRLRAADVQHRIDVHDLIESMDNSDKVWSQAARAARR